MTTLVTKTPRLELRRFSTDDAPGMFALNADPETLRYTGDVAFESLEDARSFLAGYDHYTRHGFGRWSVYLRSTGAYIGFCGLARQAGRKAVDLGFRIAPAYRRRGFATEAARAALDLGFGTYGLDAIIARAMPENHASQRVLRKLGFTHTGEEMHEDGRWFLYELQAAELSDQGVYTCPT